MRRALAIIGFGLGWLAFAGDETRKNVELVKTERIDFPPAGTLRLRNSIGELRVEGWDRPDVEITATTTKVAGDKVSLVTERHGDELAITVDRPRRQGFPLFSPFGAAGYYPQYDVKVPGNARLIVDHGVGDVHVNDMMGDIHVTVHRGEITLHLPEKGEYAIDAKSDFGGVISDFPGRASRKPWLAGHRFLQNRSAASRKLYLRAGYGDILILQTRKPPMPVPVGR